MVAREVYLEYMDDEFKKRPNPAEITKQEILDNLPITTSRSQLRDILSPLVNDVKKTIIESMPILPKEFKVDTTLLKDVVGESIRDNVEITNVENNNMVVQQVEIPNELIELLKLQNRAITLLKNQPKEINLENYKPHDQKTIKESKVSYFGFVEPSGKWYILCQNGSRHTQRYAGGSTDYFDNWQNKEALKYTTIDEAING